MRIFIVVRRLYMEFMSGRLPPELASDGFLPKKELIGLSLASIVRALVKKQQKYFSLTHCKLCMYFDVHIVYCTSLPKVVNRRFHAFPFKEIQLLTGNSFRKSSTFTLYVRVAKHFFRKGISWSFTAPQWKGSSPRFLVSLV